MRNVTYARTVTGAGLSIGQAVVREGDALKSWLINLPAGNAGTLTTRTSDTVGTATLATGHSITTAAVVDIYWSGGRRYGVTVGTVSGDSVPFSLGSGDNLPVATTALVITEQVSANVDIDGDNVQLLAIGHEQPDGAVAQAQLQDSGGADIDQIDLVASKATVIDVAGGDTNSLTGNPIVTLKASNASSDNAATLSLLSLEDSTP